MLRDSSQQCRVCSRHRLNFEIRDCFADKLACYDAHNSMQREQAGGFPDFELGGASGSAKIPSLRRPCLRYLFMSSPIPSRLQTPSRCLASASLNHSFADTTTLSHFDAAEWAPSTASLADIPIGRREALSPKADILRWLCNVG